MRLIFRVEHSHIDGERSYSSTSELSEKTGIETLEAHARTMIKILADQALKDCDSDDDDGSDEWKETAGHS
jgi:hypothetical protein